MRTAAVVRILTGILFVAEGASKLFGDFVRGGFAKDAKEMAERAFPFWKHFLEATVLPHAEVFCWVVALGEFAMGIGLVLGLLTRVAAAGGALLMLSIGFGFARPGPGAAWEAWITAGLAPKLAFLLFVLLFAADPGKVWGLDGRMRRRGPARAR